MHSILLLRSTLLAVLPLVSRARPETNVATASISASSTLPASLKSSSASSITVAPPKSSSTSSISAPSSVTTVASSGISVTNFLTELTNAQLQALMATRYLATLEEKALAAQNTAMAAKLKQAQEAAVAEHVALGQALALTKPATAADKANLDQAEAKMEARQRPHQVRQAGTPNKDYVCNLLSGDATSVGSASRKFTYNAINKGSKDSINVILQPSIRAFARLKNDVPIALKAPNLSLYPEAAKLLQITGSAAELALGSLYALEKDNSKRRDAITAFFLGASVIDLIKVTAVESCFKQANADLAKILALYQC